MTPEIRASGRSAFARARISAVADRDRIGTGEIEHDATDIGFVDDVARHDLEHDGRALREQRRGVSDRLLGIGGGKGRHHRDVIGLEQPLDLDRIEPLAAVGERVGDDLPGSSVSGANALGIAGGTCASASTTSRCRTRCMKPRTASSSVG